MVSLAETGIVLIIKGNIPQTEKENVESNQLLLEYHKTYTDLDRSLNIVAHASETICWCK